MVDATDYLKSQVSGWIAQNESFAAPPSNIYIALHNGEPGSDASNNELDPNAGAAGYSRYESASPADWTETSPGSFENTSDFLFDQAQEDWGEVTHFSLWDSQTGGNAIAEDSLVQAQTINNGDEPVFRAGNVSGVFD